MASGVPPATVAAGLLISSAAVPAIAAVAVGVALRRRPAIGAVTMGPGGWVSLKRTSPPLRAGRPWWARLPRGRRLVVQR